MGSAIQGFPESRSTALNLLELKLPWNRVPGDIPDRRKFVRHRILPDCPDCPNYYGRRGQTVLLGRLKRFEVRIGDGLLKRKPEKIFGE